MSELAILKKAYNSRLVSGLFRKLVRRTGREFSLTEALVFGRAVDFHARYSALLSQLTGDGIVVEVGGGKLGVGVFLPEQTVISIELDPEVVRSAEGEPLISSASHLPLRGGIAGVAVSVDCLEHLPRKIRRPSLEEMKRVSKEQVLVHTPYAEGASLTDYLFYLTHKKVFGSVDVANYEHILYKQPKLSELERSFPGAALHFTQNTTVTYILFVLQRVPVLGWLTGLLYLLLLKPLHKRPPYYGVLIDWRV